MPPPPVSPIPPIPPEAVELLELELEFDVEVDELASPPAPEELVDEELGAGSEPSQPKMAADATKVERNARERRKVIQQECSSRAALVKNKWLLFQEPTAAQRLSFHRLDYSCPSRHETHRTTWTRRLLHHPFLKADRYASI